MLKSTNNPDNVLDSLFLLKYPPEQLMLTYMKIRQIQQNNYLLISEYYAELQNIVIKMSYCNKTSKKEQMAKVEELFFKFYLQNQDWN
jgi:hypothetical protein